MDIESLVKSVFNHNQIKQYANVPRDKSTIHCIGYRIPGEPFKIGESIMCSPSGFIAPFSVILDLDKGTDVVLFSYSPTIKEPDFNMDRQISMDAFFLDTMQTIYADNYPSVLRLRSFRRDKTMIDLILTYQKKSSTSPQRHRALNWQINEMQGVLNNSYDLRLMYRQYVDECEKEETPEFTFEEFKVMFQKDKGDEYNFILKDALECFEAKRAIYNKLTDGFRFI